MPKCWEFLSCWICKVIGDDRLYELVRSHESGCIKHGKECDCVRCSNCPGSHESGCIKHGKDYDCVRCSKCLGLGHTYSTCANKELLLSKSEQLGLNQDRDEVIVIEYKKKNLSVLKLNGSIKFYLDPSVDLPGLETLSLFKARVPDEHKDRLSNLISGCPVLEELHIEHCEGLEKFSVCSTSIKKLRIYSANNSEDDYFVETPNVEVLYLSMGIKQPMENDMPSLVDTRLNVWTSNANWIKLLHRIRYTQNLVIHQIILNDINIVNQLPIFHNLTRLEVGIASWSIILEILSHAPKLVFFTIHKLVFDRHLRDMKRRKMKLILERIEYYDFDVDNGVEVAKFFLSNCALLKKFIILIRGLDSSTQCVIMRKLLMLRRISSQCRVVALMDGDNYESEDSDSEYELSDESDSDSESFVDVAEEGLANLQI